MDSEILKVAATQGLWATVAVALIFYILRSQEKRDLKQDERENNYQEIIKQLTDSLSVVKELKEDVEEIKNFIFLK